MREIFVWTHGKTDIVLSYLQEGYKCTSTTKFRLGALFREPNIHIPVPSKVGAANLDSFASLFPSL